MNYCPMFVQGESLAPGLISKVGPPKIGTPWEFSRQFNNWKSRLIHTRWHHSWIIAIHIQFRGKQRIFTYLLCKDLGVFIYNMNEKFKVPNFNFESIDPENGSYDPHYTHFLFILKWVGDGKNDTRNSRVPIEDWKC